MASLKRQAIRLIERVGARGLLAAAGSAAARRATGRDVELLFDDIWIRRVGDRFYGDKARFDYYPAEMAAWNHLHGLWENDPVDCWFHRYAPQAGDVVIDVGAGFGNDAIAFSRAVGPKGRVYAIEAHPVAFRKLMKTCKWSGLDNVVPIEAAVDAKDGVVMISGEDDFVGNAIDGGDGTAHEVKARPLDDLATERGIGEVALLKMNIEGAERGALGGAAMLLARTRNAAIACHDFRTLMGESEFFRTKDFVRETLDKAGFEVTARDDPRPYVADTLYGAR
jgi:FkbM family methyltransferase